MSKDVLRRVKEEFDLESYVFEHYDVKRAYGKNGEELRICCPSCGDTKFKCYINPEKKAFHCFKCSFSVGNKLDIFDFVATTEGISKGTATMRLLREHKPVTPEGDPTEALEKKLEDRKEEIEELPLKFISGLPDCCVKLTPDDDNLYWQYVRDRGFTKIDLIATNLHYVPDETQPIYNESGKYKGDIGRRIVFPIYGPEGKLVSWLSRTISKEDTSTKYFNCPESDLSKTLWPFSKPLTKEVVLVEGIIDALSVRRVEGVSAYAVFGKKLSREQMAILKLWGVESVTVWFDKKDAKKEIIQTVANLKMRFSQVYVLDLADWPKDKDTGYYLSVSEGPAIIKEALTKRVDTNHSLDYAKWQMTF